MRLPCLALLATLAAAPPLIAAPADMALAREVTAEVNGQLAQLTRTTFTAQWPGGENRSRAQAWRDATGVRKIEVTEPDDSGSVVTEYYFRGADLVFVYAAIKGWKGEREVTRVENRLYFRGGELVHWLGGMDKVVRPPSDPDYPQEARTRLDAARFYREAAALAFRKVPASR